jgi:hypothetical protein
MFMAFLKSTVSLTHTVLNFQPFFFFYICIALVSMHKHIFAVCAKVTRKCREQLTHQSTRPTLPPQSPILGDGTQDPQVGSLQTM